MIFYHDGEIRIRKMETRDAQIITDEETKQGWNASVEKYLTRIEDQAHGHAIALVAEYCGDVAGYVNVYPDSKCGAFAGCGYPEIVDFGVLERYRRRGIGTKLMDVAEQIAAEYADVVYLGVGLHSGYGSAQRMYVKRGYIPDGSGVWYKDSVCECYAPCHNDDELILYFFKKLKNCKTQEVNLA